MTALATVEFDDKAYIKSQIKKFNINDLAIAELAQKYADLKIDGFNDQKGFELVSTARKDVKAKRCLIENKRKDLVEIPNLIIREINQEAKRLTNLITPIEDRLEKQEKDYEAEIKRVEQEKIRQQEENLKARIGVLLKLGFRYDGKSYISDLKVEGWPDKQVTADLADLKKIDDGTFNGFVSLVEEAHAKRQAELAEIERKRHEEAEKAERERRALEAQLADERRIKAEEARKAEQERAALQAQLDEATRKLEEAKREDEIRRHKEFQKSLIDKTFSELKEAAQQLKQNAPAPVATVTFKEVKNTIGTSPLPALREEAKLIAPLTYQEKYAELVDRIKKLLPTEQVKMLLEGLE